VSAIKLRPGLIAARNVNTLRQAGILPDALPRVKTHYLRGRDAGHFGRWLGERSDVIYMIMSDQQRRQRPKGPRPFGLQRLAEIKGFDPRPQNRNGVCRCERE
jgi:hypothetical protein